MNVFHVVVSLFEEYDSLVSSSCSGHVVLLQYNTTSVTDQDEPSQIYRIKKQRKH
jgi:hypothetical protein